MMDRSDLRLLNSTVITINELLLAINWNLRLAYALPFLIWKLVAISSIRGLNELQLGRSNHICDAAISIVLHKFFLGWVYLHNLFNRTFDWRMWAVIERLCNKRVLVFEWDWMVLHIWLCLRHLNLFYQRARFNIPILIRLLVPTVDVANIFAVVDLRNVFVLNKAVHLTYKLFFLLRRHPT